MEKSGKQVPPSSSAQSLLDSNLDEPSSSNTPSTSAESGVERSQNLFTNQSPSLFMRFMNLGISGEQLPESSQSHSHEEAENAIDVKGADGTVEQKNDGEGQDEIDRMSDDGYPLVMDFGHSERQSRMAKQRLIEQVIQEQGQAFEQDVMEELENANSRRVFDPIEEGEGSSTQRPANALNHEGMAFTPRVEAAIAHYMVRKYADGGNAARSVDASGSVPVDGISVEPPPPPPPEDEPSSSSMDAPPVNILPASRNLPMSNFIAIGRRPFRTNKNRRPVANSRGDSSSLGWQATKPSLKDRLGYMFCNEVLADVYFIVGKDEQRQRIPAHKFVLSIGSVVFDAMFNGGLTPSNSRDPLEIELPDVEPPAFLTLLRFLYSDEVNIGPESVMTTLYTAKKYAVPAMETACVEFLKQSLGADNAFMLLTQARLFDEPQLEQLCLELIDKNTHEALGGEGFSEIDLSTLCVVLARDTLRITEAPLFQAVVRWATEECVRRGLEPTSESKRSVLGSALHLIRFPLMTVEEFAQTAAQSGLLSDREVVNLFLYFTVNPKPSTSFNDRPRCAIAGKELVVGRFQRNEVRWGYSGMPDRIKFTVDRKIYVIGFGLYGGIVGPYEYPCTIQIIHCGTGKVMATNDTTFVCDGSSSTFRVLFRDPVEITPSVTYIASAYIKGPDTHYGTKGLRRIVHQSNSGGSVTFQFTYAAGNNNGTSVEDGQIPEIIFYSKLV